MYKAENIEYYKELSVGIIDQAIRDFKEATEFYYKVKSEENKMKYLKQLDNIIIDINSDWFRLLCEFNGMSFNPNELIDKLYEYFDEYPNKIKKERKEKVR